MAGELIKQKITKALIAKLEEITIANGYDTDLGLNVFAWKVGEFNEVDLPACSLNSVNSTWEISSMTRHQWSVRYELEAVARASEDAALVLDQLEADIMRALGSFVRLESQIISPNYHTTIEDCEHGVRMTEKRLVGIRLRFTSTFSTKIWDPYARDVTTI